MAQTKISQLTELSSIADNDVLAGVDTSAGTTKKVKMSTLKSYINTGDAQDVQINGTSIVSGNVANIAVEGTYNASTNKIETVSDVNGKTGTLSNLTTTNKTNLVSAINELNTNKEDNSNKTDTLDENSTNTQYPSAKATYDLNSTTKEDLENELAETQAQLDTYKTIFNALPKVSGTGESISLDGTAESPLKVDLKGNTSQDTNILTYTCIGTETGDYYFVYDNTNYQFTMPTISASDVIYFNTDTLKLYLGSTEISTTEASTGTLLTMENTPNPNYPQPIHVVSGDNSVVVCRNLFSAVWEQGNINSTTGLNQSSDSVVRTKTYIKVIPNQHYALKRDITGGTLAVRCYDKNHNYLGTGTYYITLIQGATTGNPMGANDTTCVIAPKDEVYYFRFIDASNDLTAKYMMVCGDTPQDYEPYEKKEYTINLGVKNLFDKNNATYNNGHYKNDNGGVSSNAERGFLTSFVAVKPNTQYTFSSGIEKIYYYNNSQQWISRTTSHAFPWTTTTPDDCYYIQFQYVIADYNANTMQIEEGSTAHSYTPYGADLLELCKIGTYQDYLYKDNGKWYKYGMIGKYVYNNDLQQNGITSTRVGFLTPILNVLTDNDANNITFSNILASYPINNTGLSGTTTTGKMRIYVSTSYGTTYDDIKAIFANKNLTIYHVQATPTITEITNPILIQQLNDLQNALSYQNQTNISQINGDLGFVINAQALLDISNLENRVTLLEE